MLRILLLIFFINSVAVLSAQEYRSFDGTGNNQGNPLFGATHTPMKQRVSNGFADGISAPAGSDRPNPRLLSNRIFGQDGLRNDPLNLSDFCWVWGQFLDHDITLTPDGQEPFLISVPRGDRHFDPQYTGQVIIPMMRSMTMEESGTEAGNPRQFPNEITAFIDGSNVYGSDEERADWLRSFVGGKMKVSAGNLLPFNTIDGEYDSPIDSLAPHMDDPMRAAPIHFVAGDARANENPLLASFHTLFVREHNRLCDELAAQYPNWEDEQLFQHARKLVGGQLQAIVFEQYLPAMGIDLTPYQGYKANVDPAIFNVFAAAAFRLGHTLLNGNLNLMTADGDDMPDGDMTLRDAFFNPLAVVEKGGIEPFIKGMGAQIQQSLDQKVIDDVRNFLFGAPGAGGLDLAAININRGRERGLPDFNTIRADFGLAPYQFYEQINVNPEVYIDLQYTYFDINIIDPWVGMLAEQPMPGALFGETLMAIMKEQFTNLRDGDRFYYDNDPDLSLVEKQRIRMTRLADVIRRNTDIEIMQEDVFHAMSHEAICAPTQVSGNVRTQTGDNLVELEVILKDSLDATTSTFTTAAGTFAFAEVPKCEEQWIYPVKNDDTMNGISTFDIIVILKDILGTQKMTNPYQIIAADVNNSGSITTGDLIALRRLILGQWTELPDNTSWRFVDADYVFPDPLNPFLEAFPERVKVDKMYNHNRQDFIAIKIGDVNNSAIPNALFATDDRTFTDVLELTIDDMHLEKGQTYTIPVTAEQVTDLAGYQFTLNYASDLIELNQIQGGADFNQTHYNVMSDAVTVSWNGTVANNDLLTLNFTALAEDVKLSEVFDLDSRYVAAEAYEVKTGALNTLDVNLNFNGNLTNEAVLYQNTPNPFATTTAIRFDLPEASEVQLEITDLTGRIVAVRNGQFAAGSHQFDLTTKELVVTNGVLNYRLIVDNQVITKRMVVTKQ
ncbi:MAG: peroxidase family protein [Saprospiraceae bacterium]